MTSDADLQFLREALERGALSEEEAADCRGVLATLRQLSVPLSVDEIAQRRGYISKEEADEIKRVLARRRVGKYEVLDRLGEGGGGVVWRARDTNLGRIVALKLLTRPEDCDATRLDHYREKFRREARVAVTLNHVNVVRGLDFGEADGYIYFAMEFVAGESIAARLRREGRLAEREALRIALETVRALEYVQRFDLVHRDVKPGNLLVTPEGDVKVCDFGLARPALDDTARSEGARRLVGTPSYMSPEQIRDIDVIDWRADVYGLGATLFHMLTGGPPFPLQGGVSIIHRHLNEDPPDPREHVLEISHGAAAIVIKMLAKERSGRYASLDDLASDLAAVLDGRPPIHALSLAASGPGAVAEALADLHGVRASLRGQRRRRAGAVVAAATLVVALAWWGWSGLASNDEAPAVVADDPNDVDSPDVLQPPRDTRRAPDDVPSDLASDPGRDALAIARNMEAASEPLRDLIERYGFVAERYAKHPSGKRAALRVAELKETLAAQAEAEFASRQARAADFESRGLFGQALALYENFPRIYAETPSADRAAGEAERVRTVGGRRSDHLLSQALAAARERRVDDAESLLSDAADTGVRGTRDPEDIRFEVAIARSEHSRAIKEQAAEFAALRGDALLRLGVSGIESARGLIDGAVASGTISAYAVEQPTLYDAHDLRRDLEGAEFTAVRLKRRWLFLTNEARTVKLESAVTSERHVTGRAAGVTDAGDLLVEIGGENVLPVPLRSLSGRTLAMLLDAPGDTRVDRRALLQFALSLRNFVAANDLASLAPLEELPGTVADQLIDLAWAAAARSVRHTLQRVDEALAANRLQDAWREVSNALDDLPGHAPSFTRKGVILMHAGSLDEAEKALRRAITAPRPDANAHLHLARLLARRDQLAPAEAQLRLFLEKTAESADAPSDRLREAAERELAEIGQRRVEASVATLRRAGKNALRRRDQEAAAEAFTDILDVLPDDPDALLETGLIYVAMNRHIDAFRLLRRFVDANPDHRRVRKAREALTEINRFRNPTQAGKDLERDGRAALAEGHFNIAIPKFDGAIRTSPFLAQAYRGLGQALLGRWAEEGSRSDLETAESRLDDALLLTPDFGLAYATRSDVRLALGRVDDALDDAEAAMRLQAGAPEPYLAMGRATLADGRPDDALGHFAAAFDRRAFADPLYWQALALERLGKRGEAWRALTRLYDEFGAPATLKVKVEELYDRLAPR